MFILKKNKNMKEQKVRAVFISDVHLGLSKSKTKQLLKFLKEYDASYYILIGDIIDLWKLQSSVYWSKENNDIFRKLLKIAGKSDKEVVYVPGNHDEFFRDFSGINFGGIKVCSEYEYISKDGLKVLCIHGDIFDKIILHNKWIAIIGSWLYDFLLEINEWNHKIRSFFKMKPWSLSKYLKHKAKSATGLMESFKTASKEYAAKHGYDMVITGHIHKVEIDENYANCGDWVESCSAIIETLDGHFIIVENYH
jgi:UDP-2,3-diacylglucosamine pyrophosphatase LpxH